MSQLLFISDLHLSPAHPGTLQLFLKFLKSDARQANALYILGDLFDSWVGDDEDSELASQVRQGLTALSKQTQIYFQPGNRDFLLGQKFAGQTGIRIMEEETVIEINGRRILLIHGDLLCTDDLDYQQARKTLRSEEFIRDFLARPLQERALLAAQYRKLSGEATSVKALDIMDVNQQTVLSFMRRHQANYLIHGHTHRPGDHSLEWDGHPCQRLVLAAWSEKSAQVMQLAYSADKPGMVISRYEAGGENSLITALDR